MTALLVGCASNSSPLADVLSAVTAEKFGSGDESTLNAKLNPLYRYLRIEAKGGTPALLVLGYVDAHPLGDIEVWYSSKREVIKTQNGRIVSTTGLETDWRSVQFSSAPPIWTAVPPEGSFYQRVRDEMPGHRYAISERIELQPWVGVPATLTLASSLLPEQARTYGWFRETTRGSAAQALPPAWFALGVHIGRPTVVYSEQCLSVTFCLKLQLWPVQEGAL